MGKSHAQINIPLKEKLPYTFNSPSDKKLKRNRPYAVPRTPTFLQWYLFFLGKISWSEFILGCENILYEIARGLYNNNINKIWKTKKEKELVIELWETLYLNIRTKIWLHRCNEVIEEEKKKGITKRDKKLYNENKRKKDESEVEKNEIHETYRKNQKHWKKEKMI